MQILEKTLRNRLRFYFLTHTKMIKKKGVFVPRGNSQAKGGLIPVIPDVVGHFAGKNGGNLEHDSVQIDGKNAVCAPKRGNADGKNGPIGVLNACGQNADVFVGSFGPKGSTKPRKNANSRWTQVAMDSRCAGLKTHAPPYQRHHSHPYPTPLTPFLRVSSSLSHDSSLGDSSLSLGDSFSPSIHSEVRNTQNEKKVEEQRELGKTEWEVVQNKGKKSKSNNSVATAQFAQPKGQITRTWKELHRRFGHPSNTVLHRLQNTT